MYGKWNHTIQRFLAGCKTPFEDTAEPGKNLRKNVPLMSQELKSIFDNLWSEIDDDCFSCSEAEANRTANRYANILPFNHNRVVLKPPVAMKSKKKSDYINASLINHQLVQRQYIMCQGPLESTAQAFWTMVVQQKVSLIVMLGNFVEQNKLKCYEYVPFQVYSEECRNESSEKTFGCLKITCTSVRSSDVLTERELQIESSDGNEVLWKCTHCHFSSWSDFGVPAKVEYLERLLNFVNKRSDSEDPLIVHCSAGVGRSGVFVFCDIVLSLLSQSSLDAVNYVEELLALRKQRMKSIQTFQQFLYALQVLRVMYPKVANWGSVSPVKKELPAESGINSDADHALSDSKVDDSGCKKRKLKCLSDICRSDDSGDSEDGNTVKKPPPCPLRTTSLMAMAKEDSELISRSFSESSTPQRGSNAKDPVVFLTPSNKSTEKHNRSFFSLNKTDSKLMLKNKLVGKRKLGSSLRKSLMTKFKKLDRGELNQAIQPVSLNVD